MNQSSQLFEQAQHYLPGGVNSPVRAFRSVGSTPVFVKSASGAHFTDVDNQRYIDYVGSWGPMIVGHAHPEIIQAVQQAAQYGLSYGAPTAIETQMAEAICDVFPSIEMVRMCSSGTEATMSAVRLARGFTQRDKIIKFEGCYHGHADAFLIKAGSGALTLGVPDSPGVPAAVAANTLVATYNDMNSVSELFAEHSNQIACIIVEPIAGNMNCILPEPGFLEGLRKLCDQHGALLIFDEVMTGFRVARGGAQELYHVNPDLTTLGKVIGGGMPVGAFGGRRDVMSQLAPTGPVYQAGTLSGNPIAMTAGLKTIELISQPDFYSQLEETTARVVNGIVGAAADVGIDMNSVYAGGMFGLFFTTEPKVSNFKQATECNQQQFKQFFHGMLSEGIYFAPSAYEAGFVSAVHSNNDVETTLEAAAKVLSQIAEAA